MKIIISILFFAFLEGCAMADNNEVKIAINFCLNKYQSESGVSPAADIDRVYIHKSNGYMNLIFTHGEMGTFGDRADDYSSFISCGVKSEGNIEVVFIQNEKFEEVYAKQDFDLSNLSFELADIKEYLFKLSNGKYIFYGKQDFNPDKINNLNI